MVDPSKRQHWNWLLASFVAFAIACATPALEFEKILNSDRDWQWGIGLALVGWIAILVEQFGWFANLSLALGWLMLASRRTRVAAVCGVVAFLIALHTLQLMSTSFATGDDRSSECTVSRLGPGFICWLLSMLVLPIGAIFIERQSRSAHASTQ